MTQLKQQFRKYIPVMLAILLAACADNSIGVGDESLTLTLRINAMTTGSVLKAAVSPTENETAVGSLHLLFFTASDDQSGTFAGTVSLPGGQGTAGKLTMETGYILPEAGDIHPSEAYHIIGIGNLGDYIDNTGEWLAKWEGKSEAFFRDNAMLEIKGTGNETDYTLHRPIKTDALPMNGYAEKPAGTKNIRMTLTRNVARFDVKNNAATHTLQTVSVWNASARSSVTGDAPIDYSSETLRTKRFYGVESPASPGNELTEGVYAFANYTGKTGAGDKRTTCLIIGLTNADGDKRYFRVNVNAGDGVQHIKNNYLYRITILSVTGEGYSTENEAWEGAANQLVYDVNNWDIDDNGLIVSDEYSILALPVKTVKIDVPGGEFTYSVTAFTTLSNPEPLRIKSQLYDPADGNISARISNGNLVINALPAIADEDRRSGIVTISFAGLETTVNILQTALADTYLKVTLDDGWEEFLPPAAHAMSEYIYVDASGPWTAQLFGSAHFAFQKTPDEYIRQISSVDFTDNKFRVFTSAAGENEMEPEKGFVMVSLDSDPDNYIAVVPVGQLPKEIIPPEPAELIVVAPSAKVPPAGGRSDEIDVSIEGGGVKWTASVTTVTNGERPVFNHQAVVLTASGNPVPPEGTDENLKVEFPKIYFPNRQTEIKAVVTVTTTDGTKSAVCEVYQESLAPKVMKIWNLRGSSYGALGTTYINSYTNALTAMGYSYTSAANPPADNTYPAATTYIHLGNQFPSTFNWTAVNNFRNNEDGIIMMTCDDDLGTSVNKANEFLSPLGYQAIACDQTGIAVSAAITNSRIGQFLTTRGKEVIDNPATNLTGFHGDLVRTYVKADASGFQNGGIAVLVNPSNTDQVYMAIDPIKRIVFLGECQVFDDVGAVTEMHKTFMRNFIQYVDNAARYGSHFIDLLIDNSAVPEPWSAEWGSNAWPN